VSPVAIPTKPLSQTNSDAGVGLAAVAGAALIITKPTAASRTLIFLRVIESLSSSVVSPAFQRKVITMIDLQALSSPDSRLETPPVDQAMTIGRAPLCKGVLLVHGNWPLRLIVAEQEGAQSVRPGVASVSVTRAVRPALCAHARLVMDDGITGRPCWWVIRAAWS
jgi:hypothetical protein